MTIPYKNRKGYFKNYYREHKPLQGVKSVKINTNDLTPNQGVKNEGVKKGVNLTPQIVELKEEINELKKELIIVKSQLENLQQLLTKKPTEISVKKEPKKVIVKEPKPTPKPTSGLINRITPRFDKNLLVKVQSFLTDNKEIFPSFAQLVKDSISAYLQKKIAINQVEQFNPREKKTVRLSGELNNFYLSLPEGEKTLILNQILSAFLTKQ